MIKKILLLFFFFFTIFNIGFASDNYIDEQNINWDKKIRLYGQLILKDQKAYNGMYITLFNSVTGKDLCSGYSQKEFFEKNELGIYDTGYNGMLNIECDLTLKDLIKYKNYIYLYLNKPTSHLMKSAGIKIPLNLKSKVDKYELNFSSNHNSHFPILLDIKEGLYIYNYYYTEEENNKILSDISYQNDELYKKLRLEYLELEKEKNKEEYKKELEKNKEKLESLEQLSKDEILNLTSRYDNLTKEKKFIDEYQELTDNITKENLKKLGNNIFFLNNASFKEIDSFVIDRIFLSGNRNSTKISINDLEKIGNLYYIDISLDGAYPNILKIGDIEFKREVIDGVNYYGNKDLLDSIRTIITGKELTKNEEKEDAKVDIIQKNDTEKNNYNLYYIIIGIILILSIIEGVVYWLKRKKKQDL